MAMTEQIPFYFIMFIGIILFSFVDIIKTKDVTYELLNEPSYFNPVIVLDGHGIYKRQANQNGSSSTGSSSNTGTSTRGIATTPFTVEVKDEGSHKYYASTVLSHDGVNYWDELTQQPSQHASLTNGHRIAVTVELSFEFPFYGHKIKKVTIATGGFLYMSPFLHSWLTATQYIAPLMANFDTTIGNESDILYKDYTEKFVVEWRDVFLKDYNHTDPFIFQTTLHKNGSIVFGYKQIPINIKDINTDNHPVKVGVSDAFYVDATVSGITRRTIYEYHRVEVNMSLITSNTIVVLQPLLTCNRAEDCETCVTQSDNFECKWCPAVSRCSDGIDWYRQQWLEKGCRSLGHDSLERCNETYIPPTLPPTPARKKSKCDPGVPDINCTAETTAAIYTDTVSSNLTSTFTDTVSSSTTASTTHVITTKPPAHKPTVAEARCGSSGVSEHDGSCNFKSEKSSSVAVGGIIGIILVLLIPIVAIIVWVVYAYRNPTSSSGIWLMEHRPSVMKQKISKMNIKFWNKSSETGDKYKIESTEGTAEA